MIINILKAKPIWGSVSSIKEHQFLQHIGI
jgi:hypothetical protein